MHRKGEMMQITKKKQVCLIVVLGILTLVAMCFLKEAQNDPKRYSNGKIVKMEERYGRCILKLPQEVQVVNRKIYLKDVAEIYCEEDCLAKRIGDMILYTVKGDKNEKIVFSVMKIIRQVQKECPGIQIESIGESDFILEYKIQKC